ncbi:hypothetical protein [Mycolicibacterium sp. CBMA 361]|uniref:hypothetical protein n=1 Tax=Mycolicibacterium sp. CBMA 361 TaxID=2606610 RepID=UPI001EF12189|nr:hypothetical protein [Mycolicibacterium sp. CBMA 361]
MEREHQQRSADNREHAGPTQREDQRDDENRGDHQSLPARQHDEGHGDGHDQGNTFGVRVHRGATEAHGPFRAIVGKREAGGGVLRGVAEDSQVLERRLVRVECHDVQPEHRVEQRRVNENSAEFLQVLRGQVGQCQCDEGDRRPPDDLDDVAETGSGDDDGHRRGHQERDDRPFHRVDWPCQSGMHKQRDDRAKCKRQIQRHVNAWEIAERQRPGDHSQSVQEPEGMSHSDIDADPEHGDGDNAQQCELPE